MTATIVIKDERFEVMAEGTISDTMRAIGYNPTAFVFAVNGSPVPMDTPISDGWLVKAIKVASGG